MANCHPAYDIESLTCPMLSRQNSYLFSHRTAVRLFAFWLIATCLCSRSPAADVPSHAQLSDGATDFLATNCFDCHQGDEAEAGLHLDSVSLDLSQRQTESLWVRVFDRVNTGEMPPPDYNVLEEQETQAFLSLVGNGVRDYQQSRNAIEGRVRARRLTRKQIERSLHSLLGIDIPLAEQLPEESKRGRYSTFAEGQSMSHFQMQSHLQVVDLALDEAFRRAIQAQNEYHREFDARGLARTNPKRRCREPEMRQGQAVIWNGTVTFYGRIPATTAPADGWYRFKLRVSALKPPKEGGVWSTIRTGLCVSSAPLLTHVTSFEATEEPKTIEFEAWLPKGHMLEIRPGDATLKRGRFAGGQIGAGEGEPQNIPGIAFDQLTMQQIHRGPSNDGVRELLFGSLKGDFDEPARQLENSDPQQHLRLQVTDFARRAFRRSVNPTTIQSYIDAAQQLLESGGTFHDALRYAYRAMLCSPRFLYFHESPGTLDAYACATRLSYFLTGSCPDAHLMQLAESGDLLDSQMLRKTTQRLVKSHGQQFVKDFADEWLDLEKISAATPNRKLYPDFDPIVQMSMLHETRAYLQHLLEHNLGVRQLVNSQFTFLNSRLARYYGIENVDGDKLAYVSLPPGGTRGGLMTHGSILKVTANGATTSPVLRGVWVCERLLGISIPPPPENVPAIEPDIRGATTIREQLEKHRSDAACAKCHTKIDPAGFALENFDATGQWRDFYRNNNRGDRRSKPRVDASYELPDGRAFGDIRDFRRLVAEDERRIAANLVENLLEYATGGSVQFADRDIVESIVDSVEEEEFGLRSIIEAVVVSPLFLEK